MKKIPIALLFVVLLMSWSLPATLFAADEEALGDAAVKADQLRSGFEHFIKALKTASERSEKDKRLIWSFLEFHLRYCWAQALYISAESIFQ